MVKSYKNIWIKTFAFLFIAIAYVVTTTLPVFSATLTNASITLGDPRANTTSTYTAQVSGLSTGTSINCIQLDIGTSADGTGDAGLNLSSITLNSTSIPSSGSWTVGSVDGATDQMRATLVAGATPNASGNVVWGGVVNGPTDLTTYYGVLNTYANTDCSTGGPVDSVTMTFVYKNGALVTLTIDPSLTFACAAVNTGTDIYPVGAAGPLNTTVTSTPTAINHSNAVTASTNGISAHDLTTTTNASNGFNVYIRNTAQLTNLATDTIAYGGLTSASFPAPGTEAWAWSSDDSDLALNGAGSGLWNSFSTTNAIVASETGVASTTNRVSQQVGVAGTTPAGTYTTTVIYTAVATY